MLQKQRRFFGLVLWNTMNCFNCSFCAASNLCQWSSLFAWTLLMTGNTWPGTVRRLKKLIGIWIGALGHYSDIGKKLAKQGSSFAKWVSDQLRVRLAHFDKRHSNKTDCQVIWQGLDTHSLGRGECWTQAEVLREPPVLEEKPGSAPKWANFLILTTYCTAVEGTEWLQGMYMKMWYGLISSEQWGCIKYIWNDKIGKLLSLASVEAQKI